MPLEFSANAPKLLLRNPQGGMLFRQPPSPSLMATSPHMPYGIDLGQGLHMRALRHLRRNLNWSRSCPLAPSNGSIPQKASASFSPTTAGLTSSSTSPPSNKLGGGVSPNPRKFRRG